MPFTSTFMRTRTRWFSLHGDNQNSNGSDNMIITRPFSTVSANHRDNSSNTNNNGDDNKNSAMAIQKDQRTSSNTNSINQIDMNDEVTKPKASNSISFRPHFQHRNSMITEQNRVTSTTPNYHHGKEHKISSSLLQQHDQLQQHKLPQAHAQQYKNVKQITSFPTSHWIQIDNVPPLATLDDILSAVQRVLDIEYKIGMISLDHDNHNKNAPPSNITTTSTATGMKSSSSLLEATNHEHADPLTIDTSDWIQSAKVVLSYRARPSKWRIQLKNISMVHAFLEHFKQQEKDTKTIQQLNSTGIGGTSTSTPTGKERRPLIIWKESVVTEWHETQPKRDNDSTSNTTTTAMGNKKKKTKKDNDENNISWYTDLQVSDHMVRVENCPPQMTTDHVRHLFRRFHLGTPSVYSWKEQLLTYSSSPHDINDNNNDNTGINRDFKDKEPHVYIVNFQDASWARAAIRELQGVVIQYHELRLAQFPKQL